MAEQGEDRKAYLTKVSNNMGFGPSELEKEEADRKRRIRVKLSGKAPSVAPSPDVEENDQDGEGVFNKLGKSLKKFGDKLKEGMGK